MNNLPQKLGAEIVALAREQGFALAGVCEAGPSDRTRELRAWLGASKQGEMSYLERNSDLREDVRGLIDGGRSVVIVADLYSEKGTEARPHDGTKGRIARYARGNDYHAVMKKRLHELCDLLRERFPDDQFRAFVDTAPVLEREHAARAGIGWVGKHTLLIHPRLGSWMFLGGFVTTLDLKPPESQQPITDHCGTCTRCIDACPTDAITPYSVDARKCISYLTIEHRTLIDPELHEAIGDWIFGCDICQDVCPHNGSRHQGSGSRHQEEEESVREEYEPKRESFDLLEVLGWTEDDRRAAFAQSSMKRAKLDMMKRNALIAAGNALRQGTNGLLRTRIDQLARDNAEPDLVWQTASQVIDALTSYTDPQA